VPKSAYCAEESFKNIANPRSLILGNYYLTVCLIKTPQIQRLPSFIKYDSYSSWMKQQAEGNVQDGFGDNVTEIA
jgi:hypothetical protein